MAFRAPELVRFSYDFAASHLLPRGLDIPAEERAESEAELRRIIEEFGPVIETYPAWHPLVATNHNPRKPCLIPSPECGYNGLGYTQLFANAFITCISGDAELEKFKESIQNIKHPAADISAIRLGVTFYDYFANVILVRCLWKKPLLDDGTIPLSIAAPLLLQMEVPNWEWMKAPESWERIRRHLLGTPQGSRSSLFVNQETGQGIKKLWNTVIETGMFGPVRQ